MKSEQCISRQSEETALFVKQLHLYLHCGLPLDNLMYHGWGSGTKKGILSVSLQVQIALQHCIELQLITQGQLTHLVWLLIKHDAYDMIET